MNENKKRKFWDNILTKLEDDRIRSTLKSLGYDSVKNIPGKLKVFGPVTEVFQRKGNYQHQSCTGEPGDGVMILGWEPEMGLIEICSTCRLKDKFDPDFFFDEEDFWETVDGEHYIMK